MNNKTHWKKFHNPDYIGAYAFQPEESKVLTIREAKQEKVQGSTGKKEDCLVVYFTEPEKPLICNVTNSKAIAKVVGSNFIEDWPGTRIELYVTMVSAFGDQVEAVRVRTVPPRAASVDPTAAIKTLNAAKTIDELAAAWKELSKEEKANAKVAAAKDARKNELQTPEKK